MTELNWRHIDYLLKQWGRWVWLYGESVGCYPSQSAHIGLVERAPPFSWFRVRQLTAKGRGTRACGSHRILGEYSRFMPDFIKRVNIAVHALPEGQYLAILVKYATGLDAFGREWPDEMRAIALEITEIALDERLRAARKKIARVLANTTGKAIHFRYRQISVSARPA